jgi:hypothetical protein
VIYTITIIQSTSRIRFGFNRFSDMESFLSTVMETVEGFDTGETTVIVAREEENPASGN